MREHIETYRGWGSLLLLWGCLTGTSAAQQAIYKAASHDFGKIREVDGPVSHTFEFTNTSAEPMLIEFISVSCGCTTPEYSKEPVLPGKQGKIVVTYDPAGRPGAFNNTVVVTSGGRRDQTRLTIQGEVLPRPKTIEDEYPVLLSDNGLRAKSNNLIFGYLGHGNQKTQTLDIYNNGTSPMRLGYRFTEETKIPREIARVEIAPAVLPPKGRGQVTFTYDLTDSDVYGLQAAALVLTNDGKAVGRPVSAYVTATDDFTKMTRAEIERAPEAEFSAQFYHFGTVGRGEKLEREFTLKNVGRSPLVIRAIVPNHPSIGYTLPKRTVAPGETITLKAALLTPTSPGRVSESLSIVVNAPGRPMREIRLGATVE